MFYWPFWISLLDEEVCGSAPPDHSSNRMSSLKCTRENTRRPSFVIRITPSLVFLLISCIPDYSPRNAAFWGFVWKCMKQRIRDCSGPVTMWFNSMAVSWCDKACESPKKCKEEKNTFQVSVRGSWFLLWACLCPGLGVKFHIHLLLLSFCDCVAGC